MNKMEDIIYTVFFTVEGIIIVILIIAMIGSFFEWWEI